VNASFARPLLLVPVFTVGCFTPAAPELDFDVLAFSNPHTAAEDAVVQPFSWEELRCPDGSAATFYAVYRTSIVEPAPIVLFFHAGAFDFVEQPTGDNPLAGPHYAGEDRMNSEWAGQKVFETFGLLPGEAIDPSEVNSGTLPAALSDVGAFTIYPANCWGDLWHNEDGYTPNDWGADGGVHRQGRFMAWAMTRFASRDAEEAAEWRMRFGLDEVPVPLDASGIHVVGLGTGGRALPELYRRVQETSDANFPAVLGALSDSTMDNLYPVAVDATQYPTQNAGLRRIFYEDINSDIGRFSMQRYIQERGLSTSYQMFYSTEDPQVPDDTVSGLAGLASAYPMLTVTNTGLQEHVHLNNVSTEARDAVATLLGR
jgi:hypothetical protein